MGNRYWISGVQLGLLTGADDFKNRQKIYLEVEEKQFIGNYETGEEQKKFLSKIDRIKKEERRI